MSLKADIIMCRAKNGLSQRAFAKRANVSETTLVKIETGKAKKVSRLTRAKIELAIAMADEENEKESTNNESV